MLTNAAHRVAPGRRTRPRAVRGLQRHRPPGPWAGLVERPSLHARPNAETRRRPWQRTAEPRATARLPVRPAGAVSEPQPEAETPETQTPPDRHARPRPGPGRSDSRQAAREGRRIRVSTSAPDLPGRQRPPTGP